MRKSRPECNRRPRRTHKSANHSKYLSNSSPSDDGIITDLAITFKEDAKLPKPAGIYPMSNAELKDLKEWTEEMLAKGFIQPSKSPIESPCFYVSKKDSMTNRMVVDYR